jgi:hypothetical protein
MLFRRGVAGEIIAYMRKRPQSPAFAKVCDELQNLLRKHVRAIILTDCIERRMSLARILLTFL